MISELEEGEDDTFSHFSGQTEHSQENGVVPTGFGRRTPRGWPR